MATTVPRLHPLRLLFARLVWLLHSGVTVWLLVGPFLPQRAAWWLVALGNPLIHLQWRVLDDRCLLTILEERLRGPTFERRAAVVRGDEPVGFVAETLSRLLGRPVGHGVADALSYGVVWAGVGVVAVRLWSSA